MESVRITRKIQVLPPDNRAEWRKRVEDYLNVNFPAVALLTLIVVSLAGFWIGMNLRSEATDEPFYEYGDTGTVSATAADPVVSDHPLGPAIAFDPTDWYEYLRRHPKLPRDFLQVKPNKNGVVLVAPEDYFLLEELTGGLPPELPVGAVDTKWDFFLKKNVPLEDGEDFRDAFGLDKSYFKLEGEE